jgi:hypothetical protein
MRYLSGALPNTVDLFLFPDLMIPYDTLYTIPFTIYTIHHTPYTIHYTLYTLHFTLYTNTVVCTHLWQGIQAGEL